MRIRAGIHTGIVQAQEGDYFGQPLNRVARLMAAAHGGQTLLSEPAYELIRDHLPAGVELLDLGEHRLKDLARPEHIYQVVAAGFAPEFPPPRTLDYRPNNLPAQPTALIGREKELADLQGLLERDDVRLVTLTGPGGIGKTRLALQLAADCLDDFLDGVWFVNLAPITDPSLVISTVAQTLGVKEMGGQPIIETVNSYLREKQLLLLLDSLEQVISSATQVSDLLAACPQLKVLATSRIALRLRGEREYSVPPLRMPDTKHMPSLERLTQYEAVSLFIERAQGVQANFEVNNQNAPAVAEICHRLDGLPLAIELAAARIKILSPQAMLIRLENRLKILTGGARDLPARQQTIRKTIEWSYDHLSEGEKQLFRRMAIFQGGATLEALEAVCNFDRRLQVDVLDGVEALMSNSLLQRRERMDAEPRFVMLGTIHEFARQILEESGEADQMRQKHADYFVALADRVSPSIISPDRLSAFSLIDSEHDNFRAALEWCASLPERYDMGLHLVANLSAFWVFQTSHMSEGRAWLVRMLALTEGRAHSAIRGNAMLGAGVLSMDLGDYASARSWLTQSIDICEEARDYSCAIVSRGSLALTYQRAGNPIEAIKLGSEALERIRKVVPSIVGPALGGSGGLDGSDRSDGADGLNTPLSFIPPEWSIAYLYFILGDAYMAIRDLETARDFHRKSLELYRKLGAQDEATLPLTSLGKVAMLQGNFEEARSLLEESLAIRRKLDLTWFVALTLTTLSDLARYQGDYKRAERLARESIDMFRDLGDVSGVAWALKTLGCAALHRNDPQQASDLFKKSLQMRKEQGNNEEIGEDLLGLAEIAAAQGDLLKAAHLLGAISSILDKGIHFEVLEQGTFDRSVAILGSRPDTSDYQAAWAEGRAMTIEEAVAYALEEDDEQ
jgi:predicted ATPase